MLIKKGKEDAYNHFIEINSHDPYSLGVVRFMTAWAGYLEKEIDKYGDPEKAIYERKDDTMRKADDEAGGITGFMYGCAVNALREFWEYGDILNRIHNKEYGVENDNGTVNPAVLTIG